MTDRKTILILISIVSVVIILIAILIIIYKVPSNKEENNNQSEQNNLYFIIENKETGYGISKTNGSVVLKPEYSQIARVDDCVYLKSKDDSYMFFLNDGKSVSLGGKESEVYFVYDKYKKILPYYVLRYGESEQTSIYRIFNDKGIRHDTKDFSTLNDAYKFLNAKEVFKSVVAPTSITSLYTVISTLNYPTSEGKTQYIVTKQEDKQGLQGLVDESGRIILELTYKKISSIQGSINGLKAETGDKTFIFLVSEKLIEVEPGFEFITSNSYVIQKKGNTVNKIYNSFGEVVVDGIYNINEDLTSLNLKTGTSYMLVQEKKGTYSLYNIASNKKVDNEYTNILLDYITDYSQDTKNTAFMYKNNEIYYAVDLDNLKSYKMNISSATLSPLDIGIIYKAK
ncbi:MAG: hypothetical protein PHD15_00765 [Clostridia bacterium]|nr:hypothetical protein [Clostridia bacterium]